MSGPHSNCRQSASARTYASLGEWCRQAEGLLDVLVRCAIGIGGLHCCHSHVVGVTFALWVHGQACRLQLLGKEDAAQGGNLVAIKEVPVAGGIVVVVHQAISVTIKGSQAAQLVSW